MMVHWLGALVQISLWYVLALCDMSKSPNLYVSEFTHLQNKGHISPDFRKLCMDRNELHTKCLEQSLAHVNSQKILPSASATGQCDQGTWGVHPQGKDRQLL